MKAGTAMTTTQAPSVNFETRNTMVAMPVITAPIPLMVARRRQPGGRSRRQCTTRPVCESVKPTNTPMAKSGMSVLVLPRTATMSAAAISERTTIPLERTCRSPRRVKRWGR